MAHNSDQNYMKRAVELARRGGGYVNPNPQVGAVIVKDGEIIGEGYHEKFGGPHAEIRALEDVDGSVEGSTLFVTLEPCVHYGKTPPCTEAIIDSGISRVEVAVKDPNPKVSGKGLKRLRKNGVEVSLGLLEDEARDLNEIYFHYVDTGKPFVLLKLAMTLDGKIATRTGDSRWISGDPARKSVHEIRARYSAVGVGVNTVKADDPRLNVRKAEGPDGAWFVFDSNGSTPIDSRLLSLESPAPTVVVAPESLCEEKVDRLEKAGAKVWRVRAEGDKLDLEQILTMMGDRGYDSLLVEGGGEIAWSLLAGDLVDKIRFFYAPKIIGGRKAVPAVGGQGVDEVKDGIGIERLKVERLGSDLSLVGYPDTQQNQSNPGQDNLESVDD
jgi:diaminohydroxyphosphoribosylaminopyrimidine deaminase/5-amino-6-(5-phosphoribosylamino)uracil reductase